VHDRDYEVRVVEDACAASTELEHREANNQTFAVMALLSLPKIPSVRIRAPRANQAS